MKNFKKLLAVLLAGLMILSFAACGEKDDDKVKIGVLQTGQMEGFQANEAHREHRQSEITVKREYIPYSNLSAALMDLESGRIDEIGIEKCTADYVIAHNDNIESYEDSKEMTVFSMMTLDTNKEVYDILNNAIKDMKADGTLDSLIANELKAYINSDPAPKELPKFDGARTIKIGVTGDVPPMDFVSADGKAAGFNIALLTEIANRAQVNIELVQIETASRPMALSSNKVDAVFWTKGTECPVCGAEDAEKVEGTLVTESYYSDYFVKIKLKSDK